MRWLIEVGDLPPERPEGGRDALSGDTERDADDREANARSRSPVALLMVASLLCCGTGPDDR